MLQVKSKIQDLASDNILKAQARQKKKNFDKRHLIPSFNIGSQILLKNMAQQARQGGKMESHFTGSYEIVEKLGKAVYRFKNLKTNKISAKTYNSMMFKLYHSANVSSALPQKRKCEKSEGPLLEEPLYKSDNWIVGMNLKTSN